MYIYKPNMHHKYKWFAFIYIIYIASSIPPKYIYTDISPVVPQSLELKQDVTIRQIVVGAMKDTGVWCFQWGICCSGGAKEKALQPSR